MEGASAIGGDVLAIAQRWREQGRRVALATVAETWGSAPRPAGSHLVIDADGQFEGSVSGGCVEGAVILEALEVIGVDAFTDGHAVLKARIKTVPLKQWDVGRELRRQIGRLLVERKIEMPATTINVKVDGLDEILRAAAEERRAG